MELFIFLLQINIRFMVINSHIIIINISNELNDTIAPIEDIMFQVKYVSG